MNLWVLLGAVAIVGSVPLLGWSVAGARAPRRAVVDNLRRSAGHGANLHDLMLARSATERVIAPLTRRLSQLVRRLTPVGTLEALRHRIVLAGQPREWPIERILAGKAVLVIFVLSLGAASAIDGISSGSVLTTLSLAAGAFVLPDLMLRAQAQNRQEKIRLALPDTLDQLTVCMEAGLGFDAAMARTGQSGAGVLAEEILRTLQEMQLGATRRQALRALADRTETTELRRLVQSLLQAESYGIPIANVLRTQAHEVRLRRRQRAEERAMKLPVKLVFPLVLCILPSLFVVILGPAALHLIRFFSTQVG